MLYGPHRFAGRMAGACRTLGSAPIGVIGSIQRCPSIFQHPVFTDADRPENDAGVFTVAHRRAHGVRRRQVHRDRKALGLRRSAFTTEACRRVVADASQSQGLRQSGCFAPYPPDRAGWRRRTRRRPALCEGRAGGRQIHHSERHAHMTKETTMIASAMIAIRTQGIGTIMVPTMTGWREDHVENDRRSSSGLRASMTRHQPSMLLSSTQRSLSGTCRQATTRHSRITSRSLKVT